MTSLFDFHCTCWLMEQAFTKMYCTILGEHNTNTHQWNREVMQHLLQCHLYAPAVADVFSGVATSILRPQAKQKGNIVLECVAKQLELWSTALTQTLGNASTKSTVQAERHNNTCLSVIYNRKNYRWFKFHQWHIKPSKQQEEKHNDPRQESNVTPVSPLQTPNVNFFCSLILQVVLV